MLVDSLENNDSLVSTSTQANIENHVGAGPPPPPLAPLSGGIPRFPMPNKQTKLEIEDSDSTGNNSIASSSGIRDNCSATGNMIINLYYMYTNGFGYFRKNFNFITSKRKQFIK